MAFLNLILQGLLGFGLSKLTALIQKALEFAQAKDRAEKQAQEDLQDATKLKPDSPAKDIDEAIDKELNHF
jgi:hypothetical protein